MLYKCVFCEVQMDSEQEEVIVFAPCEHTYHAHQVHPWCMLRALIGHVMLHCPAATWAPQARVHNDPMWG